MGNTTQTQWMKQEESARHGAAIFLTLASLIALDTVFAEDEGREKRMKAWIAWGIVFILLAFFIITPEQEALQATRS